MSENTTTNLEIKTQKPPEKKDNYEPVAWVAIENCEKVDRSKYLKG